MFSPLLWVVLTMLIAHYGTTQAIFGIFYTHNVNSLGQVYFYSR